MTQNDTIHALIALVPVICSISGMSVTPSISIIIPSLEPGASLERLLKSLRTQTVQNHEVIVVFNRPSDAGENLVAKFAAKSFTAQSVGVNIARNLGLTNAKAPIALMLDDDSEIDDTEFLNRHIKAHAEFESATAVGGPYRLPANPSRVQRVYHELATDWMARAQLPNGFNFDLLGGNTSYKVSRLPTTMRFDPTIPFGGTETEFHLRLARRGDDLKFKSELSILHHSNASLLAMIRKAYSQGYTFGVLKLGQLRETRKTQKMNHLPILDRCVLAIYRRWFSLGERGYFSPPRNWFSVINFLVQDQFVTGWKLLTAALNCRTLTTLHILLREELMPRKK